MTNRASSHSLQEQQCQHIDFHRSRSHFFRGQDHVYSVTCNVLTCLECDLNENPDPFHHILLWRKILPRSAVGPVSDKRLISNAQKTFHPACHTFPLSHTWLWRVSRWSCLSSCSLMDEKSLPPKIAVRKKVTDLSNSAKKRSLSRDAASNKEKHIAARGDVVANTISRLHAPRTWLTPSLDKTRLTFDSGSSQLLFQILLPRDSPSLTSSQTSNSDMHSTLIPV